MKQKSTKPNIPEAIQQALKKIKRARGILFTGSRVRGTAGPQADWDFIVLIADNQKGYRRTWKIGNDLVETFCHPQKELNTFLKTDPIVRIGVTTYMLASGIIIQDTPKKDLTRIAKHAQKVWQKGPKPVGKAERDWIGYDIATYLQDAADCIATQNPAYALFAQAANEVVRYAYALSGVWLPLPKERLDDLQKRMPKLHTLVVQLHTTADWQTKAQLVIKLGEWLAERFKLDISGLLPAQQG